MDKTAAASFVYAKMSGILSKSFVGERAQLLINSKSLGDLWTLYFHTEVPGVPEFLLAKKIEEEAEKKLSEQWNKLLGFYEEPEEILTLLESENDKSDMMSVKKLLDSAKKVSGEGKEELSKLIKLELQLKCTIWVLRLRVFYGMDSEDILKQFSEFKEEFDFTRDVKDLCSRKIDSFDDWKNWKFKDLLNGEGERSGWEIDPVFVEKQAKSYLYDKSKKLFHRYPMSNVVLYSWYKIKQHELEVLRCASESLRLG